MDKQYLNDEFNRFFDFPKEDKSQVSSVSAKLFAEHIAYPLEREIEKQAEEITTLRQRVAELEKEVATARLENIIKYGVSHPEMYKSEYEERLEAERDALIKQRDDLLAALEYCRAVFDEYIDIHLDKTPPDYDKAARNENHRAACDAAITSVKGSAA